MKYFKLLCILFCVIQTGISQDFPSVLWDQTHGGAENDYFNDLIQLSDGNLVAAGVKALTSGSDPWIVKLDSGGNVIWDYTYTGARFNGICESGSGDLIAVGYTTESGAGGADILVVRISAEGVLQWEQVIGGSNADIGEHLVCTDSGGITIVGTTRSYGSGENDLWVINLNASGELQWDTVVGGATSEAVKHIKIDSQSNYVIVGAVDAISDGVSDGKIWSVDQIGNLIWQQTYGGAESDSFWDVVELATGELLVTGGTRSIGAGDYDVWLVRTSSTGDMVWQKTFGGGLSDYGYAVTETLSKNIIIAGSSKSFDPNNTNIYSLTLTEDGDLLGEQSLGGPNVEVPTAVLEAGNNSIMISAWTNSIGNGQADGWLISVAPYLRQVRYVSNDGSVSGDGSFSNPYSSIQTAIGSSATGDTIRVFSGTYQENINFNGKNLVLESSDGPQSTVLVPQNPNLPILWLNSAENSSAIIDGFSFSNASSNAGVMTLQGHSAPVVRNCIITNNNTPGNAVYVYYSGVEFQNCLFTNNYASALIFCDVNEMVPKVLSCTFSSNYSSSIEASSSVTISPIIINSIFWGNGSTNFSGPLNATYSLVENGYYGEGNFDADPVFVDAVNNDFSLQDYSPAIGSGLDATFIPNTDIDGNLRPNPTNSSPDLGAYENPLAAPLHNTFINVAISGVDSGSVGLESAPFATIQAAIDYSVSGDTVIVQPGTYVENINYNGKNIVVGSLFLTTQDTSYISQTVIDGNQNGSVVTFDNGETTDAALTGLTLRNGIANFGGGIHCSNTNPTISNLNIHNNEGIGHGGGIYLYLSSPHLSNLRISNNSSAAGGGVFIDQNSNPVIYRSEISNNTSTGLGGGIFGRDFSDFDLIRSTLSNNHSTDVGGGLYLESSTCTIEMSILSENLPSNAMLAQVGAPNTLNINNSNIEGGDATLLGENGMYYRQDVIDVPSRFVDSANDNYRLLANSMCVNAGHPDSTDSDGSRADMGAYPYLNFYSSTDWHVSFDGDDLIGTGAESNPFASIQAGINFANVGNRVLVGPGTYVENVDFLEKEIHLISTMGAESTIIDGAGVGTVVKMWAPDKQNTLRGFTLQNGSAHEGGGLYLYSNGVVDSCIIQNNETPTYMGGGAYVNAGTSTIKNTVFRGNQAAYRGAGVYLYGTAATIDNCLFENNQTNDWGAGIHVEVGAPHIKNCIIKNNSASTAAALDIFASYCIVENCLIYGNSSTNSSIVVEGICSPLLINNTITQNISTTGSTLECTQQSGTTVRVFNSIIHDNSEITTITNESAFEINYSITPSDVPGNSNINTDPHFNSAENFDFTLKDYSPAIGTGLDTTIVPTTDINGNPRPSPAGSNPDMGAYENPFGTPQHMPITINVPDDYATIQAGLNAADSTDTVLVQPGTYVENIIWPETNGIILKGLGDDRSARIDGNGISSVLFLNPQTVTIDSSTVIMDMTIANGGNAYYGGGITLLGASPTIYNLLVSENAGERAGGIYMSECNSKISHSIIKNNESGDDGGGITVISSNPNFNSIEITDNTSIDDGGGVYFQDSDADLLNVIVNKNVGNEGGGMYFAINSILNISEVTIAENYAIQGGGICVWPSDHDISISNLSVVRNVAEGKGGGIYIREEGDLILSNITMFENSAGQEGDGLYWYDHNGTHSLTGSNIVRNGTGMHSSGSIEGVGNYWGHSSGPYHPSQNQIGQGDSANIDVNVTPWLTSPSIDAPPIPPIDLVVMSTGDDFVTLAWSSIQAGDFAHFNLYFDNDSSGILYENSVVVGSGYEYTLAGLELGTEYFLALTVYDIDGNESWYSNEVTATTRVMEVQNLDIAGDEDLQHITTHNPLITFDYFDSMGEAQTAYQVQISTDSTFQGSDIWDTGVTLSDATSIQYDQGLLANGQSYCLRAKVASGEFWSGWSTLTFRMNSEPEAPIQISLINNAVTTGEVNLVVGNSIDAEGDELAYDFRLYTDESLTNQLDSAIAVSQGADQTTWAVNIALDDNVQYWWTAQAYDGYEYSELVGPESFLVNIENDTPSAFSLLYPELGQSVSILTPILNWAPAYDPDPLDTVKYALYLDTPEPGVEIFDLGTDTSFQVISDLLDNTNYSWKVVASDLNGAHTENTGGYQNFSVNTSNDLPMDFILLSPVADMMVNTLTPEFLWQPSSDPDDAAISLREPERGKGKLSDNSLGGSSVLVITGYDFYLGTDADLTDVVPVEVIATSHIPAEDLIENQVYYWSVSALDDSGGVTFSDTASFWTNSVNSAPSELSLLTPVLDTETGVSPTFSWTTSEDEDLQDEISYTLKYGPDVFSLMAVYTVMNTVFTPEELLSDNTEYIWQVVAEDLSGAVYTTEFSSFFVNSENDVPGEFSLIGPDSASWITNTDVMLVWEPSSDAEAGALEYVVSMGSNVGSLESVDTVSVNYYALQDLEDGYYFWQVEAIDELGDSQLSSIWTFLINANNDAPDSFALYTPLNGVVLTEQIPSFTWQSSSPGDAGDLTSYRLLLGSSIEDVAIVYEGVDTSFVGLEPLVDNAIYYWQVEAIDLAGAITINEGGYQSFIVNTINDAPSMATLISPDSVVVLTDMPTFSWNASSDIDPLDSVSYEVHWWADGVELDSVLTDETSITTPNALTQDNLEYTWEVIAMDTHDGLSHSETKSFWVDFMPEVPGQFTLVGPDSASAGNGTRPELTWTEAIDPDPFDNVHYRVAIATDSLFDNVVFENVAHIETLIPESDLENDTRYYWQVTAIDEDSLVTLSDVWTFDVGYLAVDEYALLPEAFTLQQNFPNPFNPSTTIRYGLPEDASVSLVIYDIRGNTVRTIESGSQVAGWYEHIWNGIDDAGQPVSTGLYLTRFRAGSYSKTIKMLYLK